jgi:hypothetical protein
MYKSRVDLHAHRSQVAQTLEALEASLARLVSVLAHSRANVSLEDAAEPSPVRRVCEAYSAINYQMEDEVGESVICPGVVAADLGAMRCAAEVNALKERFKKICAPLRRVQMRIPVKGEVPTRKLSAIRVILRNIQRSDLNLLAAYRKIPLLGVPPASITYTRAYTRSVYRKSVDELFTLLSTSDGPKASADRARLESLSPRETHLAFVKHHYGNIRANIVNARLDARGRGRLQIAAELPILYSPGRRPPAEVRFPAPQDQELGPRRSRQHKIEAEAFLQTIPVYRYTRS